MISKESDGYGSTYRGISPKKYRENYEGLKRIDLLTGKNNSMKKNLREL